MNITYKVALVNNYIVITSDDLPDFLGVQGPAKNVTILPTKEDAERFEFWGLDNSPTMWNELNLNQILDENGDPFTLEDWTTWYTTNTGFSTAGGGSSATDKKGIAIIEQLSGEQLMYFEHGLLGANWVQLQYSDPEIGDIYLANVSVSGPEVHILSDNSFPAGEYTIFYNVAIV